MRKINVNELSDILAVTFGMESVMIKRIDYASVWNQHNPIPTVIDWGGVLNIYFEVEGGDAQ